MGKGEELEGLDYIRAAVALRRVGNADSSERHIVGRLRKNGNICPISSRNHGNMRLPLCSVIFTAGTVKSMCNKYIINT